MTSLTQYLKSKFKCGTQYGQQVRTCSYTAMPQRKVWYQSNKPKHTKIKQTVYYSETLFFYIDQ